MFRTLTCTSATAKRQHDTPHLRMCLQIAKSRNFAFTSCLQQLTIHFHLLHALLQLPRVIHQNASDLALKLKDGPE